MGTQGSTEPASVAAPAPILSARYDRALACAAQLHAAQVRKGTTVPYLAHVLAVGSTVLEHGGDEDEAIAALLHDAVEDQGGAATLVRIRVLFGERTSAIVAGCTDTDVQPKPPWRARKEAHLTSFATADSSVLLVSLADTVHNACSILRDYHSLGEKLWSRFNAGRAEQLWYYRALVTAFESRGLHAALVAELASVVAKIEIATGHAE